MTAREEAAAALHEALSDFGGSSNLELDRKVRSRVIASVLDSLPPDLLRRLADEEDQT